MSSAHNYILSLVSGYKSTCLARLSVAVFLLAAGVAGSAQTVTPSSTSLTFTSAQVGIAAGSAESLTVTFTLTGFSSLIAPTATMHYGLSYKAGALTCTGSVGSQSCSVPVSFVPTYPGGRRDALFLSNGTTRLATVLVYGIGESPFALIQPGQFSTSIPESADYLYGSVVDENGVLYLLATGANTVYARTPAGVISALPITGLNSPRTIAIDGAGVLYIADQTSNGSITTYDTVQGTQGTFPFPTPSPGYIQSATVGNTGTVYEATYADIYIFPPTGSPTEVAINPAITQPTELAVDSGGNIFIGGYTINELTPGGAQTEVNTVGATQGLAVDAAETLYATRYTGGGVAELPASGYGMAEASIDTAASPLGASIGPDGTVFVENYTNLDVVNRSQGTVAFGPQVAGTAATSQTITLYNGGNEPLVISGLALSGSSAFSIGTLASGNCTATTTIAPGALCQVQIGFTSAVPGNFSGTLTLTTNSLNQTASAQTVALSATISGAYLTASPTSLNFGSQTEGTTSATETITLTNEGYGYAANAYSVSATDPAFGLTLGSGCASVAVGASCDLNVTFSPTAVQTYSATGSVLVTDVGPGNAPSVSFSLSGNGTSSAAPIAGLSPNPLVFPAVTVNHYSQATATLTNTGNAALTNIVASVTGADASEFIIYPTSTCGSTLAAGASCTYLINFYPAAAGGISATLSVSDSATGSPQTIALSGVGEPAPEPEVQFTPTILSAIAGTGTAPANCVSPAEPGPALQTQLCGPTAVAVDSSGNIYIAEQSANVVKKLSTNGNVTTFAGVEGAAGSYGGDNGPATAANLNAPVGLAVDGLGNVYISDSGNGRIREVNATTGTITTFVGGGSGAHFNGGTGTAVVLSPAGIAFDPSGNLYIAEPTQQIVVKVTSTGAASLFAGVQASGGAGVAGYNGDNIEATAAELNSPTSVASDRAGNIYIADSLNYRIRYVNENAVAGQISTAAGNGTAGSTGNGGVATSAEITPLSIAIDEGYDLFISDGSTLRKVDNLGNINAFAGGGTGGLGGQATAALLSGVGQPAIDSNGNVLIPVTGSPQLLSAGPNGILQFGTQAVGTTSAPLTVTVENTGNNFLNFNSLTFTATGPFTVTGGTCEQETDGGYSPGGTCTLTVTFAPTTTGPQTGSISVASNALASPSTITLQGTGTAAAAPAASLSPTTLSFGNVAIGTTTTAQVLTLSNTGNAVLNISGITISGANPSDFAETNTCGATLAAGSTCTISVTFTPASASSFAASISVADNATGSPQTATLSGAGVIPPAPVAAVSPSSVSFGNVVMGVTASAQTVTLSNTGNAAMTISGITIGGTNTADFAETNTCGETLAAGASCTISVTFTRFQWLALRQRSLWRTLRRVRHRQWL